MDGQSWVPWARLDALQEERHCSEGGNGLRTRKNGRNSVISGISEVTLHDVMSLL